MHMLSSFLAFDFFIHPFLRPSLFLALLLDAHAFLTFVSFDSDSPLTPRVSRIVCDSENYEMALVLDVNIELYPMDVHDRFTLAIAPSLYLDGSKDTGFYDQSKRPRISDNFEYVMHGRVYKCELDKESKL